MAILDKPITLSTVWASQGDKIKPDDSKMLIGWQAEIPMRQHFNWLENRRDAAIAHFNQMGVPQWDGLTEYIGGKSLVQGSNGVVYRAIQTNTGKDPVAFAEFWEEAFLTNSAGSRRLIQGYIPATESFTVEVNYRYYLLSSVNITLPATAIVGDSITLNKTPSATVNISVEAGGVISTHAGLFEDIIYDVYDEVNFVFNGVRWEVM